MAGEENADGFLGCGITLTFGVDTTIFGKLLDISAIGATRISVPAPHQNLTLDATTGVRWVPKLFSCLANSKPFRITAVFSGNNDWTTIFKDLKAITITWPPEQGYSTGGTLSWPKAGVVDFDMGVGLESRAIKSIVIDPAGIPDVTAGTAIP